MADIKTIEQFIADNFERHDYEIGPDDNPHGTNWLHKDGSFRVASPAEIAEAYAVHVERQHREEALRTNAEKTRIELRLAEALKALELERQGRTGDKTRIASLKQQVK